MENVCAGMVAVESAPLVPDSDEEMLRVLRSRWSDIERALLVVERVEQGCPLAKRLMDGL